MFRGAMFRAVRLAAVAITAVGIAFSGSSMAADAVFVVPRIAVQANGDSATAAKQSAQAQGRRRAMDVLLRRLTVEDDWVYLPRLAAGQPASAAPVPGGKTPIGLSDRTLETLESGFEVYGEKGSASSYRAQITYRFKPDAIRRLLRSSSIPYSETQTLPALVLPVLETGQGVYLWEGANPWMAAWKARPFINELTPMTTPLGDLEDTRNMTARQALSLDPSAMAAMAKDYGVVQVIVAHAKLDKGASSDRLSVRLLNAYRDTAAANAAPTGAEDEGGVENIALQAPPPEQSAAKVGDVLASGVYTEETGRFGSLASRAIESTISRYAATWKAKTLIDHSKEAIVEATAFFQSVEDWARIRAGLNATPLVGSIQVFALSPKGAELRLKIFGDASRLAVALDAYGVVFWSEDGERYLVATPAQAAQLKGDRTLRRRRVSFDEGVHTPEGEAGVDTASEYRDPELAPDSKVDNVFKDPQN